MSSRPHFVLKSILGVVLGVGVFLILFAQVQAAQQGNLVGYWKLDEDSGTTAADVSGADHGGTYGGNPTASTDVAPGFDFPNTHSLSFDGSNSYVDFGDVNDVGTNDLTISLWFKTTNSTSHQLLVSKDDGVAGYRVGIYDGSLYVLFSNGAEQATEMGSGYADGEWHNAIVTFDRSGNATGYIDGMQVGTLDISGVTGTINGTAELTFGADSGGHANFFTGSLDDVRIYSRILSADEIADLANGSHTTATWTSGTDSNFSDPNNWDTGATPDAFTNIVILEDTGTVTFDADTGLASLTIEDGELVQLSGHNMSINDGGVFSNEGTLLLYGSETLTGFTNDTDSGYIRYNTTSPGTPYTGLPTGDEYYHLWFTSSGTWELNEPLTINNSLYFASGSNIVAGDNDITIKGIWQGAGTFVPGTSTVILDSTNQTINGDNTFYNLTKTTSSGTSLTFEAGKTQTITNNLTLTGTSGNLLNLRSSTPGTQWNIDPQGTRTISYVNVQDSNNTNETAVTVSIADSIDGGNNTNWTFAPPDSTGPVVTSVTTPGAGSLEYYTEGEHIDFTVNFDEEVTVDTTGGTPRLAVSTLGDTIYANYTSGSSTSSLLFRYTVQAGDDSAVSALGATIDANGGTLKDEVGNDADLTLNNVQDVSGIFYDTIAPAVTSITRGGTSPTNADSISWTVQFNDTVEGVDTSDFILVASLSAAGIIESVTNTDSDAEYIVTVDPVFGEGTLELWLESTGTGIVDYGTENPISGGFTSGEVYTIDTQGPIATIVVADTSLAIGETSGVTITFHEAVTGFANDDLTVENGALSPVSSPDGGVTWTATLTPTAGVTDATNVITLDNTGVTDAVSNSGIGTTSSNNYVIDTEAPTVTSVGVPADGSYKEGDTLIFTINFDEEVSVDTAGGTPYLSLIVGDAAYDSDSSTSTSLVFYYEVLGGNNYAGGDYFPVLLLGGGSIQDEAGNDADPELHNVGDTIGVIIDTTSTPPSSGGSRSGGYALGRGPNTQNNSEGMTIEEMFALVTELQKQVAELRSQLGLAVDVPDTVRDLEVGSTGTDVHALQSLLIALGYSIPDGPTNYFGEQTRNALSAYQSENSIVPSAGYFGPLTRAQMKAAGLTGLWW